MKLISNSPKRRCHNCYSGNICYLIEREKGMFSEAFVFGISGGLGFELQVSESAFSFRAVRELHCITDYLLKQGIQIKEQLFNSSKQFIKKIKQSVDNDTPAMIEYDGFYFKHTQVFQKAHEKRIALIVGYEENRLLLTDFVYGIYELAIEECDILANDSNDSIIRSCIYRPDFSKVNIVSKKETREAIQKSVRYFLESKSSENSYIGIDGMLRFSEDLLEIKGKNFFWEELSEDLKQSVFTFQNYGLFLEQIAQDYFDEMDYQKTLLKCSRIFLNSAKEWLFFCRYLLKNSLHEKSENNKKAATVFKDITLDLQKAFKLLRELR